MNTEEIDDFNGVTNEEFIEYFKVDLHSRMEVINYTYPHEEFDEDGGFGEHINRCLGLLNVYMCNCYENAKLEMWSREKIEIDSANYDENRIDDVENIKETDEERTERYRLAQINRDRAVRERKIKFNAEINALIDAYIAKAKVTYIDL